MKNLFVSVVAFLICSSAFAQTDSTEAPVYLRFPTIPQFTVYKAPDSTSFSRSQLNKKKNTIFIVFSPDCSHCQHETEMLLQNIKEFKNTQFVMVSYFPWDEIMAFYKVYKLALYPQIILARDTKFFFPVFFKVTNFPSIYVYNKKGEFVKSFEGDVKPQTILDVL